MSGLGTFLRILFPESCPVCQRPSTNFATSPICAGCWDAITPHEGAACLRCGIPLFSGRSTVCGGCLQDEPDFSSARSFGIYDGVLKKAINLFKYHGIKRLSKPLSDKILGRDLPGVDIVIPVSLHKKRLRQKEFNQSALLAKHIAKNLGVPLMVDCLVKTRDTVPQVGLSAGERKNNIRHAFEITGRRRIKGKTVMLVDDVFTTGATVRECSRVLRRAGAADVHVVTLAHSVDYR